MLPTSSSNIESYVSHQQAIPRSQTTMSSRTGAMYRRGANLLHSRKVHSTSTSKLDLTTLFSQPTLSVATLIPQTNVREHTDPIDSKQLHHLLRLSALPPPKDSRDEAAMLTTLSSQLHFVREIQKVDTEGVVPLSSLRDETAQGRKDVELGLEALAGALAQEEIRGQFHRRIRRKSSTDQEETGQTKKWDVLGTAEKKVGKFFVVEGGKAK